MWSDVTGERLMDDRESVEPKARETESTAQMQTAPYSQATVSPAHTAQALPLCLPPPHFCSRTHTPR